MGGRAVRQCSITAKTGVVQPRISKKISDVVAINLLFISIIFCLTKRFFFATISTLKNPYLSPRFGLSVMPPKKRKKYDVDQRKFVEVWQTSSTVKEAAERLGMPEAIVSSRASNYRIAGVNLKLMPKGRKGVDVKALNEFLEELARTQAEEKQKPDKVVRQIEDVLRAEYGAKHGRADIQVYRLNSSSIRIRIIDPDFATKDLEERENAIWPILKTLPEEVRADISFLLLLTPAERKTSFGSMEFDDPAPQPPPL